MQTRLTLAQLTRLPKTCTECRRRKQKVVSERRTVRSFAWPRCTDATTGSVSPRRRRARNVSTVPSDGRPSTVSFASPSSPLAPNTRAPSRFLSFPPTTPMPTTPPSPPAAAAAAGAAAAAAAAATAAHHHRPSAILKPMVVLMHSLGLWWAPRTPSEVP